MVEPYPGGGTAKQMVIGGEEAPRRAWVGGRRSAPVRYAKGAERDPLAIEHAIEIMIGREQQIGRVRPIGVSCEPCRVCMTMRANDWQSLHLGVERACDVTRLALGRKQAVGMDAQRLCHRCSFPRKSVCEKCFEGAPAP